MNTDKDRWVFMLCNIVKAMIVNEHRQGQVSIYVM